MKLFKWKLDTSFSKELVNVTPSELWISHFNGALMTAYKDGLGRDYMRRVFNICNKVEKDGVGVIELEDVEFELIKECFERAKGHPVLSKLWNQIYSAIDEVGTNKE